MLVATEDNRRRVGHAEDGKLDLIPDTHRRGIDRQRGSEPARKVGLILAAHKTRHAKAVELIPVTNDQARKGCRDRQIPGGDDRACRNECSRKSKRDSFGAKPSHHQKRKYRNGLNGAATDLPMPITKSTVSALCSAICERGPSKIRWKSGRCANTRCMTQMRTPTPAIDFTSFVMVTAPKGAEARFNIN